MSMHIKPRLTSIGFLIAFILWSYVFLTNIPDSFWLRISLASISLFLFAYFFGKYMIHPEKSANIHKIGLGVISGFILYSIFRIGFTIIKPIVSEGAYNVYLLSSDTTPLIISAILVLTSFCEEYFWRGYIQSSLTKKYNSSGVFISSIGYALIHLPTTNLPLITAAFIAGLYWGIIYHRTNSLIIVIISHYIWTELIFVLLPLI